MCHYHTESEEDVTSVGGSDTRGLPVNTADPQKARGDECNRQN